MKMTEETNAAEPEIKEPQIYVAPKAPNLKTKVLGDKMIQFVGGKFETDDKRIITELDERIKTNPSFSRLIKKVDKSLGERLVAEHQKQLRNAGISGPVTSEDVKNLQKHSLEARDAELVAQGASAEELGNMANQLAQDGLKLTEADPHQAEIKDPPVQTKTEEPVDPMAVFKNQKQ